MRNMHHSSYAEQDMQILMPLHSVHLAGFASSLRSVLQVSLQTRTVTAKGADIQVLLDCLKHPCMDQRSTFWGTSAGCHDGGAMSLQPGSACSILFRRFVNPPTPLFRASAGLTTNGSSYCTQQETGNQLQFDAQQTSDRSVLPVP